MEGNKRYIIFNHKKHGKETTEDSTTSATCRPKARGSRQPWGRRRLLRPQQHLHDVRDVRDAQAKARGNHWPQSSSATADGRLLPTRAPGKGPVDVRDVQAKVRDSRRPQGRCRHLRSAMVQGIRFVPTLILISRVQANDSVSYCDMPFQSSRCGRDESDLPNATRAGLLCWPGKECLCRHANPRNHAVAVVSSPASAPGLELESQLRHASAAANHACLCRFPHSTA
jgi:hypothetical protein